MEVAALALGVVPERPGDGGEVAGAASPRLAAAATEPGGIGGEADVLVGDVDADGLLDRVGRSRAADGGDVVDQRPVRLVADGGDDRDPEQRHGPTKRLVAERPEVGEAAAAAGDDDHLDLGQGGEVAERPGDLRRRVAVLDRRMGEDGAARP